jgi:hypothetical protein
MRIISITLTVLFLLLLPSILCATTFYSPEDFQFLASIKGPLKKNSIYRVWLSSDILRKCSSECKDIRVFDPDKQEIPYVITDNKITDRKKEAYTLEIKEYKDEPGVATLTVKMPGKNEQISKIYIDTPEHDFKKNVKVYGSDNMKTWHLITEDAIYDFSLQVDLRKTEIKLGKSDYLYYRISLIDTSKTNKMNQSIRLKYNGLDFSVNNLKFGKIRINRVIGKTFPKKGTSAIFDKFTFSSFSTVIDKERNTVIILEAGLPFNRIAFKIDNPYYFRRFKIFYSETGKDNSYILMTQGKIYRFQISGFNEARNFLEYNAVKHKYFKFVIENNNNPPLEIRSINFEWVRKNLYFIALVNASEYTMYFGNPSIKKPVYDLSNFINQGNWHRHAYVNLDTATLLRNADYRPSPPVSTDRQTNIEKIILTSIVILLVVIIGYWLYMLIRKAEAKKNR